MRHPDVERRRQAFKQPRLAFDVDFRVAIFTLRAGTNFATELVRDEVQTIADAEHGESKGKHAIVGRRRVVIVNGGRASAQNDADRPVAFDLIEWSSTRQDDGKYFEFADAARNKLRVLRAKVEDYDGLFFHEQLFLIRARL